MWPADEWMLQSKRFLRSITFRSVSHIEALYEIPTELLFVQSLCILTSMFVHLHSYTKFGSAHFHKRIWFKIAFFVMQFMIQHFCPSSKVAWSPSRYLSSLFSTSIDGICQSVPFSFSVLPPYVRFHLFSFQSADIYQRDVASWAFLHSLERHQPYKPKSCVFPRNCILVSLATTNGCRRGMRGFFARFLFSHQIPDELFIKFFRTSSMPFSLTRSLPLLLSFLWFWGMIIAFPRSSPSPLSLYLAQRRLRALDTKILLTRIKGVVQKVQQPFRGLKGLYDV